MILTQAEPIMAMAGIVARRRDGEAVSGDSGTYFKNENGILYVLLADGMGSGEGAALESGMAVRLLERFLKAGVETVTALKTLNSALILRSEEEGGFTTIDLLQIDLFNGETSVYKYGAAPTYMKKGAHVSRVTCSAMPAGLSNHGNAAPDVTRVRLGPGDTVLLISDGVTGGEDDGWLREKLAAYTGDSPKELALAIVEESRKRGVGTDDRTALVLRLEARE